MKPFAAVLTLSAILFGACDLLVTGHVGEDAEWKAWSAENPVQLDHDSNPPEIYNSPAHLHIHHPQDLLLPTVPFEKFMKEDSESSPDPEFDTKMFFTIGELPVVPQAGRSHQEVVVDDDFYEEPQTPQVPGNHAGEFGQFSFDETKHTLKNAADVFTIEESELALGPDRFTNVQESYIGGDGLQETIRSIHATIGSGGEHGFPETMGEGLEEGVKGEDKGVDVGVETLEEEAIADDHEVKSAGDGVGDEKDSNLGEVTETATPKELEEDTPIADNEEPSVTLVN